MAIRIKSGRLLVSLKGGRQQARAIHRELIAAQTRHSIHLARLDHNLTIGSNGPAHVTSPLEKKCAPTKPCGATPAVCATIRLQWHCRRSWRRRSKCDCLGTITLTEYRKLSPNTKNLKTPAPSRTPGGNWVTSEDSIFRNELSKKIEKSTGNGCTFSLMSAETLFHGKW
jgi:hypothetical protein